MFVAFNKDIRVYIHESAFRVYSVVQKLFYIIHSWTFLFKRRLK